MRQNNSKTQHNECLICFSPLLQEISFVHMIKPLPICLKCFMKFDILEKTIDFYHYPLHILYHYNEFFKSLLFQYKGLYDYALKDAFLCLYIDELKAKYSDYIIAVAPSSFEDNKVRGFAPTKSIASSISSHIFTGLYKKEKYKQSDLSYLERKDVYKKIGISDGEMLEGQKVLIFDDVVTSGATLLTCLDLILANHPKTVELLVLSTKKKVEDLRFDKKED